MAKRCLIFGVICFCAIGLAMYVCAQEEKVDPQRAEKAKQIAKTWFGSLMRGETAVTVSLSDVPFAWDRKKIIESLPELEKLYNEVVSKKGKRDLKLTDIKIQTDQKEITDDTFPSDRIVVRMMIGDDTILVCIKPGDAYKAIGLSD